MTVALLAVLIAALTGCKFQHARPSGPLAFVADSLQRYARSVDCEKPDHRIFDDIDYRVCSTEVGTALYDVAADGLVLSVAQSWSTDSAPAGRTQELVTALDQKATRVVFPPGYGAPLGVRWKGDSLCHSLIVDSMAGEVIYLRTLRALSNECIQG